jgi:hypothetical protein
MNKPDGYGLWWRGKYGLSLSTGYRSEDGTHDVYLNSVGEATHVHLRVQIAEGGIASGGVRIKDRGVHIGPDKTFSNGTTQAFARAHLEWDEAQGKVTCQIADTLQGSAISALPTTARERSSRKPERFDLPGATEARTVDYQFRFYDPTNRPSSGSLPTGTLLLDFGGGSPLGILAELVRKST